MPSGTTAPSALAEHWIMSYSTLTSATRRVEQYAATLALDINDFNAALDDLFQGVLVVVGEQGPGGRLAGVVVVPDRCGQGEDALQHAHDDACRGVPAMAFQVKLPLEGVVDRLDDLP